MFFPRTTFFLCLVIYTRAQVDGDDFPDEDADIQSAQGDIVQVSMLTRHGQRTPKNPYPSDPWRDRKYWPEGWLQLTAEGASQHRALGAWLRHRYPRLIPAQYRTADILVRSTGISRTLASAFALSSALYPDQAVPIHSMPSEQDKLFSPHKSCPPFDREMDRFMSTLPFRMEEYYRQPLYQWLSQQTGKRVRGLEAAESLYSLLTIEQQRGHTLPKWTQAVFPQPLRNLTGRYLSRSSATPLLAKLRYGQLLKDILHNAEHGGSLKTKKVLIYSAHDFTVVGVLNCLGLFDGIPSGFAASIIFEVRRGSDLRGNTIDILYRNDSTVEAASLPVEKCGRPCYVKKLREVLKDILPKDIEEECEAVQRPVLCSLRTVEDVSLMWAVALGSAATGALLVVFCAKLYVCARPLQWQMYQHHILDHEARHPNYSTIKGDNSAQKY